MTSWEIITGDSLIELDVDYAEQARERLRSDSPLMLADDRRPGGAHEQMSVDEVLAVATAVRNGGAAS